MKLKNLLCVIFLLITVAGSAQSPWILTTETQALRNSLSRVIVPSQYKVFALNSAVLQGIFLNAPAEFSDGAFTGSSNILEIPMPDGSMQHFRISKNNVISEGLQQQFPEIRTFGGQGIEDRFATIKIDWNPYSGFHAMILSVNGGVFIDPYHRADNIHYISYYRKDFVDNEPRIAEGKPLEDAYYKAYKQSRATNGTNALAATACRGTALLTYRLAVACTGEYARAATGLANPSIAQTLAAVVTTVNRVDGIYEKEVSVRLSLIANNSLVVFNDPATDPFAGNDDAGTLIDESQAVITARIGTANYDIGHTFSTGGGGLAGLGVVCRNAQKAMGITGRGLPVGDAFDVDFVAHEMGHQFGGNHTFNGLDPTNCAINGNPGPARIGGTAYEVGSGTTIQAYAGICLLEDIQPNSDPHFHTVSFDEIGDYVTIGMGNTCPVITQTGNTLPVITAMQNNGVTIPVNTPFRLTATATDADNDAITYCWEQWDLGAPNTWNGGAASPIDPLFKSRIPKISGTRTFPDIRVILAGYPVMPAATMDGLKGETLPLVARNMMKFRLTVRDNRNGGGGVVTGGEGCSPGFTATYGVRVAGLPFSVATPNGAESWTCGTPQTVTWNANGSNLPPVNAALVNIKLSTDGGFTYPITILANTPNDGSQVITAPTVNTTTARIMVEAADNIFFDISNADFTINCAILPLTLGNFTVKTFNGNNAQLNWNTLTEADNRAFEIERSIGDNLKFASVGFVNALGNTTTGHAYSFVNTNLPYNTNIYYRLKQIATDGRITYSEIKMVRLGQKGMYLQLMPNPATDRFSIVNYGEPLGAATVRVLSVDGKIVHQQKINMTNNTGSISITMLPKGVYSVQVISNKILFTQKLVKQ